MSIFSSVKRLRVKKNAFNLSHDNQFTSEIGTIVPCYVHHNLLPNSELSVSVTQLSRFQALLAPIQSRVDCFVHFWKIPYRLLDANFPEFISGQTMRDDLLFEGKYITTKNLAIRFRTLTNSTIGTPSVLHNLKYTELFGPGTLWDMLGYPVFSENEDSQAFFTNSVKKISAYPLIAYFWLCFRRYLNENFINTYTSPVFANFQWLAFKDDLDILLSKDTTGDVSLYIVNQLCRLYYLQDKQKGFFLHSFSKDYFTSALPFVQLGDEVNLPLAGELEVDSRITTPVGGTHLFAIDNSGVTVPLSDFTKYLIDDNIEGTPQGVFYDETTRRLVYRTTQQQTGGGIITNNYPLNIDKTLGKITFLDATGQPFNPNDWEIKGTANLGDTNAISINELRIANALQSLKEAYARFGTRFDEWLKGFFNQNSSDKRLQLPEYLGGGKLPITVSDIEQTSSTENEYSPLGTIAGKGTGMGSGFAGFRTHIEEPSIIIGLYFIKPKAMYGNYGLNRHLTKVDDIFDFFNPKTEHLGEQAVYNYELRFDTGEDTELSDGVFGYQSRYAEYKFMPDEIHGQFLTYLNYWHLGRLFENSPRLNMEFVQVRPSTMKRPFAVQEVEGADIAPVLNWLHFEVKYIAPMSRFGTPMLLN